MSKQFETIPFTEPFLDQLAEYICNECVGKGIPLERVAVVFGGKRPALFLKKLLATSLKTSFIPPKCFTIDEFIKGIVRQHHTFETSVDLEHCYILFKLARDYGLEKLSLQDDFAQFLPWGKEILSFIDQLDLDNIDNSRLKNISAAAHIGYDVPETINKLLFHIIELRQRYHAYVTQSGIFPRGYQYQLASELIEQIDFPDYDRIIFANFFYLHQTEEAVVKSLYERGKAYLFFQGDYRRWPVLNRTSKRLAVTISEGPKVKETHFNLKLYSGKDMHAQSLLVRDILRKIKEPDQTVVVLPNPDMIMPLLSTIGNDLQEFNISMGYPLKRSSLYSLLQHIFQAQLTSKDGLIYTKDYLRVLKHPFIKDLSVFDQSQVLPKLIYQIERVLNGDVNGQVTGHLFVDVHQIEKDDAVFDGLQNASVDVLQRGLKGVHQMLFVRWTDLSTLDHFESVLDQFLDELALKADLSAYPLNIKIMNKLKQIGAELGCMSFRQEQFTPGDLFRIIDQRMESEIVAFVGSPLKGLQILGLFETRSLNFKHVIVVDMNEGVLPSLKVYEPFIPRDVMISLGLNRLELEEEIQRYQFMRLISSAHDVHLIYKDADDAQRSRFIEELVWEQERRADRIGCVPVVQAGVNVMIKPERKVIFKTPAMIDFLKSMRYSASSINLYLRSPIEFYYTYVLGVREREGLLDEPENLQIGVFVHDFLEKMFRPFVGQKPEIDSDFRIKFKAELSEQFNAVFNKGRGSDAYLMRSVLESRLNRFLDVEQKRAVQELMFVEQRFDHAIELPCGTFQFVYKVDRVDRMDDGTILILDYKTGSMSQMPKKAFMISSPDKFDRESFSEGIVSFQMPLYFQYLRERYPDKKVNAAFYQLRTLQLDMFRGPKDKNSPEDAVAGYQKLLNMVFEDIINPKIPFQD